MKTPIHKQLGTRQRSWQVELAPETLTAAGEYCLCARLISLKTSSHFQNTIQIGAGGAVLTVLLGIAKRVANQIFRQNSFFAVRLIFRSLRLKVKAQGAAFPINALKLS